MSNIDEDRDVRGNPYEGVQALRDRYRIVNDSRGQSLAESSEKASSFLTRAIGLMGRGGLRTGEGLIIQPCNGVVSFFMRFAIDVIFVDENDRVVHMIHAMKPWRMSTIVRASRFVIELPAGTVDGSGTQVGDTIAVRRTG